MASKSISLSPLKGQKLAKRLNGLIQENLGGPGGGPGWFNWFSAYVAFKILEDIGLPIDDKDELVESFKESDYKIEDFESHWNYHK